MEALFTSQVGSRRVIVFGSLFMIVVGCFAKFGALFSMIPDPVIGANFFCMFGMITAVGLSNLQFLNLNSSRNLYILGFSLFAGISVPQWISANPNRFDTGNDEINQIIGRCSNTLFESFSEFRGFSDFRSSSQHQHVHWGLLRMST